MPIAVPSWCPDIAKSPLGDKIASGWEPRPSSWALTTSYIHRQLRKLATAELLFQLPSPYLHLYANQEHPTLTCQNWTSDLYSSPYVPLYIFALLDTSLALTFTLVSVSKIIPAVPPKHTPNLSTSYHLHCYQPSLSPYDLSPRLLPPNSHSASILVTLVQ